MGESSDPSDVTTLRFRHAASGGYGVTEDAHPGEVMPVVFLAVADTPEDDYILQVRLERGDSSRAYAFAWRDGEGYRVLASPGSLEEGAKPLVGARDFCSWRDYHECALSSREDLMSLYQDVIYPRFVAGGEVPGSYATLIPHDDARAPEPTRK